MADEAYRAVFLRVHPTGKMVLSLTTESDGNEGRYAQLVAGELGVPALDVKVVPADTDRFGEGHGFNTSPSSGTEAAITSATPRFATRRSCSRAPRSGAAGEPHLAERRLRGGAMARSHRRSPTSPCTPMAPAPCRPESRADSTRRPSTATNRRAVRLERDVDLVRDLERPEQRRVRLHAPVALPDGGAAGEPSVLAGRELEADRVAPPASSSSPSTFNSIGAEIDGRAELDRRPDEDLLVDRLRDARLGLVIERLDAAGALEHAERARVGRQRERRVRVGVERRGPRGHLDQQVVSRLGRRARPLRPHRQSGVVGPEHARHG